MDEIEKKAKEYFNVVDYQVSNGLHRFTLLARRPTEDGDKFCYPYFGCLIKDGKENWMELAPFSYPDLITGKTSIEDFVVTLKEKGLGWILKQ